MKKLIFCAAVVLAGSSCSTLSKSECQNKDWYGEGYYTGLQAEDPISKMAFYRKNCGDEHGIQPDIARFEAGLKAGIAVMCTSEGGFNLGKSGAAYNNSCPKEKEDEFYKGYQRGQSIFTSQKLQAMDQRINDLETQNRNKDYEIQRLREQLERERDHRH